MVKSSFNALPPVSFSTCECSRFRVVPATWRLYRNDQPVHLRPMSFKVLLYLIEHRDRVVSGSELLDAVWGSDNLAVSDQSLKGVMSEIRAALGENQRRQLSIETRRGFGYQFIANIEANHQASFQAERTVSQ